MVSSRGGQKIEKINMDTKMTVFSRRIFFEKILILFEVKIKWYLILA
jgi:hypothetical protein